MLGINVYRWLGIEGNAQYGPTKATRAPFEDIKYSPYRGLATLTIPGDRRGSNLDDRLR